MTREEEEYEVNSASERITVAPCSDEMFRSPTLSLESIISLYRKSHGMKVDPVNVSVILVSFGEEVDALTESSTGMKKGEG